MSPSPTFATSPDINTDQPKATPPVEEAYGFASDRADRLSAVLDTLDRALITLGARLEPVLTDGTYGPPPGGKPDGPPTPDDTRSAIARRIGGLGHRFDSSADYVCDLTRRVEAIYAALEV